MRVVVRLLECYGEDPTDTGGGRAKGGGGGGGSRDEIELN